ncbi:hypothetical protein [Nocardia huaxiensis]|uniref:hypothetical protein n=1 Tax=Nocardia huaxiensis TaxID=2755382 RepID=UPI001E3FD2A7|nr:hypothetical protein [Nocardia huaxiensis]UFS99789.1 hypothetical protein LPY97_18875 [Nocardia huaxiensis]
MISPHDEVTRYLASAAHFDDDLADQLVEEFLHEPKRAMAPSPGVRAEIVLREAVAARARRRRINAAVVTVFALIALMTCALAIAWLLSAATWKLSARIVGVLEMRGGRHPSEPRGHWWITVFLWTIMSLAWSWLLIVALASIVLETRGRPSISAAVIFVLACALMALYSLLVAQRYLPYRVADTWFRFDNYGPSSPPREFVVRSCARYADRLRRIAEYDRRCASTVSDEVIVYRSRRPFVGAGAFLVRRIRTVRPVERIRFSS